MSVHIVATGEGDTEAQLNLEISSGQCFLCLQKFILDSGTESQCIQNILEYLGVSEKGFASAEYREHYQSSSYTLDKVDLCLLCYTLTNKLSSLIRQLEVTQMWINYQIQQVHKVFQATKDELIENNSSELGLQQVRRKLKSKCSSEAMRIISPKVKLERIEVLPVKAEVLKETPVQSDSEKAFWIPDHESEPSVTSDYEQRNLQDITPGRPETIPTSKLAKLLPKPPIRHVKEDRNPDNSYQCLLCHQNVMQGTKKCSFQHLVAYHVATHHLEQFFMEIKERNLASDQFAKYCQHALRSELQLARPQITEKRFNCAHCVFICDARPQTFISHLIGSHYKVMEQRISQLQNELMSNTPTDNEKILTQKVPGVVCKCRKDVNWHQFYKIHKQYYKQNQCGLCETRCTIRSLKHHLVQFHPETLFNISGGWITENKEQFHKLCLYVMNSEADLSIKIKQGNAKYECHLCNEKSVSLQRNMYHLVFKHFKILREKLEALEQDKNFDISKVETGLNIRTKPYRMPSTRFMEVGKLCNALCEKLGDEGREKCSLCNETFSSNMRRYHFIIAHMEKFFEEMKLESVNKHQFELCCSEMMKIELAQAQAAKDSEGWGYKCQYCQQQFSRCFMTTVKKHLVTCHFEIMEEHLVRLQTDRFWENEDHSADSEDEPPINVKRIKFEECPEKSEKDIEIGGVTFEKSLDENDLLSGEDSDVSANILEEPNQNVKQEVTESD